MDGIKVVAIGRIENGENGAKVALGEKYAAGLKGMEGYGHVQVLWWMDGCDNAEARATLVERKPYRKGPDEIGVFALRSPERPNPIAVSNAAIAYVDAATGTVGLHWIDAADGSPVLDLKPYTPSIDRVERPVTPGWCAHWPRSCEESGGFDWTAEFNF